MDDLKEALASTVTLFGMEESTLKHKGRIVVSPPYREEVLQFCYDNQAAIKTLHRILRDLVAQDDSRYQGICGLLPHMQESQTCPSEAGRILAANPYASPIHDKLSVWILLLIYPLSIASLLF